MNCPHCQKDFPENYDAAWCPFCGKDLSMPEKEQKVQPTAYKINWLLFWLVLLAPAAISFLAAMAKMDNIAILCPIVGGGIAGIFCATMLARRIGRTTESKILLGLLFSILLPLFSFGLGFAGCSLGGFQLNIH
jgi:hypothetical protein